MAWHFFDFGLLMPALVPAKHANDADVLVWTNNGEYNLQIRVRLREHLQYFLDNFMEEGTYNPTIHETPQMDYNYRAYTTLEAYAEGVKQATLSMDYEKFKQSSDRYSWNKKYHTILTSIWSKLCELNTPGGIWGPRSKDNPSGYTNRSRWGSYGGWSDYYDDDKTTSSDWEDWHRYYEENGSAFGNVELGDDKKDGDQLFRNLSPQQREDMWRDENTYMDWVPESESDAKALIDELDGQGIPFEDWMDYVTDDEWLLIQDEVTKRLKRRQARKERRLNKRGNRRGVKGRYVNRTPF